MCNLYTLKYMSYVYTLIQLTGQCNASTIEAIFNSECCLGRWKKKKTKRMVLQCFNGVSSNTVEGEQQNCQFKILILVLLG